MEDRDGLLKLLKSEDREVIREAVEKLAGFDDQEVIRALVSTVLRVRSKAVLESVRNALFEMKNPYLCTEVLKLFEYHEPKLRHLAIDVLVSKGNLCLEAIKRNLVMSDDPNMRKFGLDVLAGIRTKESLELVGSLVTDEHPNVKNSAIEYLRNFSEFKDEVVEILVNVINEAEDLYSITTIASTIIYGNIRDRRLVNPLKRLLKKFTDPMERHWIYKTLLFLGEKDVVKDAIENAKKINAEADIEKDIRIFNLEV